MSAGTPYDTGAPTIEVRIYRNDRLLVRGLCESEEEAVAVVEQVYVRVDDASARHGAGDVLAPRESLMCVDDDQPLASMSLPGYGTE